MDSTLTDIVLWWVTDVSVKEAILQQFQTLMEGLQNHSFQQYAFNVATSKWDLPAPKSKELVISMKPLYEPVWKFYNPILTLLYRTYINLRDPKWDPTIQLLIDSFKAVGDPRASGFTAASTPDEVALLTKTATAEPELYTRFYKANEALADWRAQRTALLSSPEAKQILQIKENGKEFVLINNASWRYSQKPEEAQDMNSTENGSWQPYNMKQLAWLGPLVIKVPVLVPLRVERTIIIRPDLPNIQGVTVGAILNALYNLWTKTPLTPADKAEVKAMPGVDADDLNALAKSDPIYWIDVESDPEVSIFEGVVLPSPSSGVGWVSTGT